MNKLNEEEMSSKEILREDEVEWWRPTREDNYSLTNKLLRTGCRPIKRKHLRCIRNEDNEFVQCEVSLYL